jgi:hypothetical protein
MTSVLPGRGRVTATPRRKWRFPSNIGADDSDTPRKESEPICHSKTDNRKVARAEPRRRPRKSRRGSHV